MSCRRSKISWSNLPSELLPDIANRLETRADILNCRAVCKDWYRSISISLISGKNILSLILPHKLTLPNNSPFLNKNPHFHGNNGVIPLVLTASSIFLVKPINEPKLPPWLVTVDEVNPGKLRLLKPFSRVTVKDWPKNFPKVLGLDKFDVKELGRVYSLRFEEDFKKLCDLIDGDYKVVLLDETMSKIDGVNAVVLYENGRHAVIDIENGSVKDVYFKDMRFDDIVVCNEIVYVIDRYARLYSMENIGDRDVGIQLLNVIEEKLKPINERKSRLVESCGELYLVRQCFISRSSIGKKRGFRVYKLDQEKNSWDEIDSIGDDRILFVTPACCFFARTSDFYRWNGNCIVMLHAHAFSDPTEPFMDIYFDNGKKPSMEVFHFEDCEFEKLPYILHCSAVIWPPPKWIFPNTRWLPKSADQSRK